MEPQNYDSRQALIGTAFILLGAIGFSAKSVLIKLAYAQSAQIDAITLMALRMLMALPFFLALALWGSKTKGKTHSREEWIGLLLLGTLGYYLASLLDFQGLLYISAGLERLILFLYPTLVVFLAALIYRKPIGKRQRQALLLSYAGIVLVVGTNPQALTTETLLGSLLVFGSAVAFAVYLTGSGHLIPRFGSRRFTAYSMSAACVVTVLHFLATKPVEQLIPSTEIFGLALALALISTVAPAFLMSAGIRRIGASNAAIIGTVGPVSTLILAYLVLDESLGPIEIIGSLMVLAGVVIVSLAKQRTQ
ncbi:MAG: DMT family transporter [Candidatus Thiodiazotropha sp.]|jgi:drug/metabolite transporter (DMT)-like permease